MNKKINEKDFEISIILCEDSVNGEYTDLNNVIIIESIDDLTYLNNTTKIENADDYVQILSIKLKNKNKNNVLLMINELQKLDFVLFAEPKYIYDIKSFSDDTLFNEQWSLCGTNNININNAWNLAGDGTTSPFIRVGIFESSMQLNHPDLRTITGNFTPGVNASTIHGTHVAGIIGAITNNNLGIAGISQVEIALLNTSSFVNSITWAIDNDIRVINASFAYVDSITGEYAPASNSHILAINNFKNNGGILICASGNECINNDENPPYPAGYANNSTYPNIANVISVGALDENNSRCDFSNYGQNSVNIYAPGKNVLSTFPVDVCTNYNHIFPDNTVLCGFREDIARYFMYLVDNNIYTWNYIDSHFSDFFNSEVPITPDDCVVYLHCSNGYHYMSGTSMSAPHVTGVAALLLSLNNNLSANQLKTAIIESAQTISISIPDGDNTTNENVLKLNAYNAVKYVFDNYIFNLNCATTMHNLTNNCSENGSIVYKVDIKCPKSYKFISNALSPLNMTFYDSYLNEITTITPVMTNNNCTGTITTYLNPGTYYLRVNFVSGSSSGNITTSYQATWPAIATLNNNLNILNYLHLIDTNVFHCVVSFNNIYGEKLFKFKLDAGNNATYSADTIKVYTDSALTNQLDRYSIDGNNYPASSNVKENELYVFLPENGTYYIEVNLPRNDYNSLQFLVSSVDEMSINYLNTLATLTNTSVFSYKTEASYFKKVDISHRSKIEIEFESNTECFNNTKLFIFKLNKDSGYGIGNEHYSLYSILQVNFNI